MRDRQFSGELDRGDSAKQAADGAQWHKTRFHSQLRALGKSRARAVSFIAVTQMCACIRAATVNNMRSPNDDEIESVPKLWLSHILQHDTAHLPSTYQNCGGLRTSQEPGESSPSASSAIASRRHNSKNSRPPAVEHTMRITVMGTRMELPVCRLGIQRARDTKFRQFSSRQKSKVRFVASGHS